jgi:ATP-binding cassette, subfamily B, bacterial
VKKYSSVFGPITRSLGVYLSGVLIRQILMVLGGYSLVYALRLLGPGTDKPVWAFVVALLVFDATLLLLDAILTLYFTSRVSLPFFRELRIASLAKIFDMPLEWHHRQNSLELVSKLNTGAGKVVQTAEVLGREFAPALLRTAISLIPLIWFSAPTAPIVLCGLAAFLWLTWLENRCRQTHRVVRHDQYAKDSGLFTECVQNVQPLLQFGQTRRLLSEYRGLQQEIVNEASREIRLATVFGSRRNLLISGTRRVCQGVWLWQFSQGRLDAAMVMYLNFLTDELIGSFCSYATVLERMFEGMEPARVLVRLAQEEPSIRDAGAARIEPPAALAIELSGVRFGYRQGEDVLRDFSLTIEPGTVVGLVGRSGVGKTTLQHLLSRMFDVRGGSVRVGGRDIREWQLEQLRGAVATVSQSGAVFFTGKSIADTLRFGNPDAPLDEVIEAARCACIHDEIVALPGGYSTLVSQGGLNFSKGQQQRLGLAQALLAMNGGRNILILDEFTSALDAHTEQQVLENLKPRLKGKTVIMIAHRLATVKKLADTVVLIDREGVVEQGCHGELVARGKHYAELVELQNIA